MPATPLEPPARRLLYHQKLEVPDAGGQILGLLYAEPGSKSEQAVAMLAATMGEPKAVVK